MRPIDADELLKAPFRITGNFGGKYPFEAITVKMVEAAPTIDPIRAAGGCYCRECSHYSYDVECNQGWCNLGNPREVRGDGSGYCDLSDPREAQDDVD